MEASPSAGQRLYSPGQIALASFLGSPIAACWFYARNYRRLGQTRIATQCLVWSVIGTGVMLVIVFFLPEHFPGQVIPIGYTVGLFQAAKKTHGSIVAEHVAAGGRLGSWWEVVGISLLVLIAICVVILGVVILFPVS